MASLFEKFIRNFYAQHSSFAVSAPHLHWCTEGTPESLALVPRMETDVVLYSSEQQILLYPAVGHDFYHDLQLDGSRLQIASINLDQDWQNIHRRLLSLLAPSD